MEKKLTDEEIVKALECCTRGEGCEGCPYFENGIDCVRISEKDTLDLIHRLQEEKKDLANQTNELANELAEHEEFTKKVKEENEKRKKILAYKNKSDSTLKSYTKTDLIEQIRILEHNWSCAEERFDNSVKNSDKIFYEQKAEIERLASVNMQTIGKNADLQMKVDEYYQRAFVYYKKCKAYGMDFKDEEFEIQAKDGKVFKMPKFTTNEEEVE